MSLKGTIEPRLFNMLVGLDSIDLGGNALIKAEDHPKLLGGCLSEEIIGNERRIMLGDHRGPRKRTALDEAREDWRWTKHAPGEINM